MSESTPTSITQQVLSLVKQQIPSFVAGINKPIMDNVDHMDKVFFCLSDEESRVEYLHEVSYLYGNNISSFFGDQFNLDLKKAWDKQVAAAPNFLAKNAPDIKFSQQKDAFSVQNCMILDFLIKGYQYEDVVKVESGEIFFDVGSYVGDTVLWAYQNGAAQVYCFEPNPEILADLKANLSQQGHSPENIYQVALSNKNDADSLCVWKANNCGATLVRTQAHHDLQASGFSQFKDVLCMRLDDWCAKHKVDPTFIKMSIEGTELEALEGAADTIKRVKPKLAINICHRTEHMWQIPIFLHLLVPEYKFYCRKYHPEYNFILYATV